MRPAIVMNMFYTGLGIARSLGSRGIPVVGLSADRTIYGNLTGYARVRRCPDSRTQPQELLQFLLRIGPEFPEGGVLFPTRDDDLLFLDRYRAELRPFYSSVIADSGVLETCLNKWETHRAAVEAGISSPNTWRVRSADELRAILPEIVFPCVLKPVLAQHWRKPGNWALVGNRKAIGIESAEQLLAEYAQVARAENEALVQEMVPGGDDRLWIAACYMNRSGKFAGGFTAQKLKQVPAGFGTGCAVQTVDRPDLLEMAAGLLERIGYTGVAEVEFKEDPAGRYRLIEINARPWDQHRLGFACGADVIHAAYCDHANLPAPALKQSSAGHKWIAEDVYLLLFLRALWKRDGSLKEWWRLGQGKRVYAISLGSDPLPTVSFLGAQIVPQVAGAATQVVRSWIRSRFRGNKGDWDYDKSLPKNCKN